MGNKVTNDPVYVFTSTSGFSSTSAPIFTRQDRLVIESVTFSQSGGSSATLTLQAKNRKTLENIGSPIVADTYVPTEGEIVIITTSSDSSGSGITFENTIFTGIITNINTETMKKRDDEIGTVTCAGVEVLLQRHRVDHNVFYHYDRSMLLPISTIPTFNFADEQGEIAGNAYDTETMDEVYITEKIKGFTNDPSQLGTKWTRHEAVLNLCKFSWPENLPKMFFWDILNPGVGTPPTPVGVESPLLDEDQIESWEVNNKTFQEAYDLLINDTVGMRYYMLYDKVENVFWIVAYPIADQLLNDSVKVTVKNDDDSTEMMVNRTIIPQYDKVIVRGSNHVTCGSVQYDINKTVYRGWSQTSETSFLRDPKDDSLEDNHKFRNQPQFRNVFQRFMLDDGNSYYLECKGQTFEDRQPFCKKVSWDGSTATIADITPSSTENYDPPLASIRLKSTLPWYKGVKPDGTDERTEEEKQQPQLLSPFVFRWVSETRTLVDLEHDEDNASGIAVTLSLKPDPNAPAMRIEYSYPEMLAENVWDSNTKDSSVNPTFRDDAGRYDDVGFTCAFETDQRLEVSKLRSGVTEAQVEDVLYLYREEFQFWYVCPYTYLGNVKDDDDDDNEFISTGSEAVITKNDYPKAEALAELAAKSAFKSGNEITLTYAGWAIPSIFTDASGGPGPVILGTCIKQVEEYDGPSATGTLKKTYTVNTCIDSVTQVLSRSGPKCMITTRNFTPNYSGLSTSLGASPNVAIKQLQVEQKKLKQDVAQTGKQFGFAIKGSGGGSSGTNIAIGKVIGGNAMPLDVGEETYPNQKYQGITLETLNTDGEIQELPEVYDWSELNLASDFGVADTLPLLPNGLCYVKLSRPYSIGTKSWNADIIASPVTNSEQLVCTRAITQSSDHNSIVIFFNHVINILQSTGAASFKLSVIHSRDGDVSTQFTPTAIALHEQGNGIILSLPKKLDPTVHTATLSFQQVVSISVAGETPQVPVINQLFEDTVSYSGYANTIIICLNRCAEQILTRNELVLIDTSEVSITDEQGVTQKVVQVLGPITPAQIHDHKSYSADGLGRAGFDIMFGGVGT